MPGTTTHRPRLGATTVSSSSMMLAGIPVPASATAELSDLLRTAGHDQLADRLKRALDDETKLLALSIEERVRVLYVLDDPPADLAELRGVLINEVEWRRREGLD
ncbi:MAG: hypothetical protein WKF41_14100 [Gaiellaceae bacterium]